MMPTEFKAELKNLKGAYLFCGEEAYLKRYYLKELRNKAVDEGDVFNHITLNSENYTPERLSASITSLPIMAETKLIEIHSLMLNSMSEGDVDELVSCIELLKDYSYNILVIYTEPDELDIGTKKVPSKLFAKLIKVLKPVVFDRESPSKLITWATKHFTKELVIAPPDAVSLLVKRCENDMSALSNEIDKIICYLKAHGRDRLTEQDVLYLSCEVKEIEAFELANCILDGNSAGAFSVLNEMKKRKERPEILLSGISRVIGDLTAVKSYLESGTPPSEIEKIMKFHSYKLSLYSKTASRMSIRALRSLHQKCYDADILIKSSPVNAYTVIERLALETGRR